MSRFHPLRIASRIQETHDAVSLSFAIPPELRAAFAFTPGQYLTLRADIDGTEIRRTYSICSGLDDSELRVAVKHVPGGAFSTLANTRLREGDMLDVMPPQGRFGVAPSDTGRIYLGLAAGSGITPILSILKTMLTREPDSRFILLYGSRATPGILFRDQLEDLKDRCMGRLIVQHVLSREQQDVPSLSGRLDADRLKTLLPALVPPATIDLAFLCGPDTMIDTLTKTLIELGVDATRIQGERFTPSGDAVFQPRPKPVPDAKPHAVGTIIAEGRSNEIPINADESVLDAALRAGLDLPWSCHAGMCSTCRARLTQGTVAMETNFSLESWETDMGYILTCQAKPTSALVVVDYDQV